jgi:hypothetical protein
MNAPLTPERDLGEPTAAERTGVHVYVDEWEGRVILAVHGVEASLTTGEAAGLGIGLIQASQRLDDVRLKPTS